MLKTADLKIEQLPVLPAVIVRLMSVDPRSAGYYDDVLRVADDDPGLALRVIHAANLKGAAPHRQIETLEDAIARLGARHIGELVTSLAVTQVFVPRARSEADLWVHAVEVATTCQLIVRNGPPGIDQHHAYLCGLLHDIGRFVMFDQTPGKLRAVDDRHWVDPDALVVAEREVFGYSHGELGYELCRRLQIPEHLSVIVRDHHLPLTLTGPLTTGERLLGVVEIADRFSVLARSGRLDPFGADGRGRADLIARTCMDPAWTTLPVTPEQLATMAPTIMQAARSASDRLALSYV